jgi:Ca2+-binding RTX toxin-like protein
MPNVPETWLESQTANSTVANTQSEPITIQLANGNIVVAWTSTDNTGAGAAAGTDIIGRIFDPEGNPVTAEFRVNTFGNANNERDFDLAALPNGNFVVVYERSDITTGNVDICIDVVSPTGTQVHGAFIVSDVAGDPAYRNPVVSVSNGTSVLVAYEEVTAGVATIEGKIYNPTANTVGSQIGLIAFSGGDINPDVATLTNGNYVITGIHNEAGDNRVIYRIINNTGGNVLAVTAIADSDGNTFNDSEASVAALTGGGFVIGYTNTDSIDTDLLVKIFDSAGTETGTTFAGAGTSTDNNNEASVVGLANGGFAVVFDNDELSRQDVTHFSATGTRLGTFNYGGDGTTPSAAALADGRFVSVWNDFATGEISLEILDTRDAPNATPVNTTNLIVGTNDGETINAATGTEVYSGAGNDLVISAGTIKAHLGAGDDEFRAGLGSAEFIDGGAGTDLLDTTSWGGDYVINLGTGVTNYSDSFTNFENVITGAGNDDITGTSVANIINTGAGNDIIRPVGSGDVVNAGAGNDYVFATNFTPETYNGGADNDTIDVSSFGGTYTVNLASGTTNFGGESFTNFENLVAGAGNTTGLGTTGANVMTGGAGTDYLIGFEGNDTLIGGGVAAAGQGNTLQGGLGDDLYIVSTREDSTLEFAGEGTDEVRTTFFIYGLQNHVENLTYTDNAQHGAGVGNTLNNVIRGGTGIDDLFGREGNDTLFGGTGSANTMLGQEGDDIYVVQAAGDSIIEFASQGIDTVQTALGSFAMRQHVENLTYTGAGNFVGVGSVDGNTITAGAGTDDLSGLDGNDILIGGGGNDFMQGGAGADQFRYSGGESGLDRVIDFVSGVDKVALSNAFFTPTAVISFVQGGAPAPTTTNSTFMYNVNNGIVSYDDDGTGAGAAVQLVQLNAGLTLQASDFIFF